MTKFDYGSDCVNNQLCQQKLHIYVKNLLFIHVHCVFHYDIVIVR